MANYPSRAFRGLWLVRSHIYQGMTDGVSADVVIQGSTPQVPNPAPKSAARTRKAAAAEKAKKPSRNQSAHGRNQKIPDKELPDVHTSEPEISQLPTLRKTQNRADISKRLSTPLHPTGTVGIPGRTSKKHFRCQDLTGTTFQGRLSSRTPTLTGLWPVARRAPSRRQKSSTPPLHSCACNSIVATSLLRSIPSSTRVREFCRPDQCSLYE
jgi:hypothetical protein